MSWIIENWPALLLLAAGIMASWATYAATKKQNVREKEVDGALKSALGFLKEAEDAQADAIEKLSQAHEKLDASAINDKQSLELQQRVNDGQLAANEALKAALAEQKHASELLKQTVDLDKNMLVQQADYLDKLTGGNSIFYLHFLNTVEGTIDAQYMILGDNPVPNVFLHITDYLAIGELKKDGVPLKEIKSKTTRQGNIGTIWPGAPLIYNSFPFPENRPGMFRVLIVQPKAVYIQLVVMLQPPEGKTLFAYRMYRQVGESADKTEVELLDTPSFTDNGINEAAIHLLETPHLWGPQYVLKKSD